MLTQAQNIKAVLLSLSAKISAAKAEAKMIEVFGSLVWGGGKIIRVCSKLESEVDQNFQIRDFLLKAVLLSLSAKISAAKAEAKMIEVFGSLVWGGGKIIESIKY